MSGLRAFLDPLYALATDIETFMNGAAGELPYIDWDDLNESAVKLRAFSNLIATTDPRAFLEDQIREAESVLAYNRDRVAEAGEP